MSDQNKALVRRALEAIWNQGQLNSMEAFFSTGFVSHHPHNRDEDIHGIEAYKQRLGEIHSAFPDMNFAIVKLFAEENRVMLHATAEATHTGRFGSLAPTGRQITTTVTAMIRLADGKIAECWAIADSLGIMQQLGLMAPIG